jgi:epsilon-lactone hydrolase
MSHTHSVARRTSLRAAVVLVLCTVAIGLLAQTPPLAPRDVPARSLPVPTTVSPGMQQIIAAPLRQNWNAPPTTPEGWKAMAAAGLAAAQSNVAAMRDRLGVKIEPGTIAGVKVFTVTPQIIAPENRDRLVMQVHGGCYVLNPGEAALPEAILMAAFGHVKVIAVDYRMPPEAYFPAALDDVMSVWKATIRTADAKKMATVGTSAGGALVLEMALRAKQEGIPLPAAIASGTPMSDLTGAGDSFQTNALIDNVLVSSEGFCDAAARFYAAGHDLRDPMLSPVYGDMRGFPPTILTTGTRDLLLSNTVRVHRKLRQAGVEAALHVYEGQAHAAYGRDDRIPETREAFEEISTFFARHLVR